MISISIFLLLVANLRVDKVSLNEQRAGETQNIVRKKLSFLRQGSSNLVNFESLYGIKEWLFSLSLAKTLENKKSDLFIDPVYFLFSMENNF